MNSKPPLDDTWLFWNAERLEEFPHVSENDHTGAAAEGESENGENKSAGLRLLEDLLLYVAGVSAAMVGVGLAVLFGSFISAYAELNGPGTWERVAVPAQPYLSREQTTRHAESIVPSAGVMEPAPAPTPAGGEMSPVRGKRRGTNPSGI